MSWQRRMYLPIRHRDQAVHDHEDFYIVFRRRRKTFAIMESTAERAVRLLSVSKMESADLCRLGERTGWHPRVFAWPLGANGGRDRRNVGTPR